MDPQDKEKTAFSAGSGVWQCTVMPFGLCNAPATFERLKDCVLTGLPPTTAHVYIDDILVSGQTFEKQIDNLRQVFQCLREAKLKLTPTKCSLCQQKVKYLGHIISKEGIATDPEKVEVVQSWPHPSSVSEGRSFLALCSYYRRFIPRFVYIAHPLHQLMDKGVTFQWTAKTEEAFQSLKQALVTRWRIDTIGILQSSPQSHDILCRAYLLTSLSEC